jgi:hypothetical protein
MVELAELLEHPRGRKSKLVVSKRRDVVASDIAALASARPLEQVQPVGQLRHQHHLLARLLAEGKQLTEAAEITGYSVTYISRLKTQDSSFKDLIQYYKEQVQEIFISVHERLKGLGLNTIEELQERLALEPEGWSKRELMELAALCLDRSGFGPTQNVKASVTVLTPELITTLKAEIAARAHGSIRQISPGDKITPLGKVIEHESKPSEKEAQLVPSEGDDFSTLCREVLNEELRR